MFRHDVAWLNGVLLAVGFLARSGVLVNPLRLISVGVADITYVPTMAGFLYLAVVLDAWSRKIVGWAMANHLRAELVLDAMEMAVGQRRPKDVIHHSDQGSQYTLGGIRQAVWRGRCSTLNGVGR